MARKGRQITAASLEAKIEKQKEILAKSKAKYEADKAEMLRLVKLRDSIQAEELLEAIATNILSLTSLKWSRAESRILMKNNLLP